MKDLEESTDSMQTVLLETVRFLQEEEKIDLKETPVVFKWSYEDNPWIEFQLFIKETEQASLPLEEPLH